MKAPAPSSQTKGKGKAPAPNPSIAVHPPTLPVVSVVTVKAKASSPVPAPSRKRSHDDQVGSSASASPESDSHASKAPRVLGRTSGGTRLSKPVPKRSPSGSPSRGETKSLPALVPPARTSTPEPGSARANVLGSIGIKKRKTSPLGESETPTTSRAGTPVPGSSKPATTKRLKPAEWDYTSSEDEAPLAKVVKSSKTQVGLGIVALGARGRRSEVKSLGSRRVAELAEEDRGGVASTPSTAGSRVASPAISRPATPLQRVDRHTNRFECHSQAEFLDRAAKFATEQQAYETRRIALVEKRNAIAEAVRRGLDVTRRDGALRSVNRSGLEREARKERERFDELLEIKVALQRWMAAHPLA
jgi:hypothetical protein